MMAEDTLLTAKEVATRLRVSHNTVMRWMREGTLPGAFMAGGTWRISEADVQAYVQAQQAKTRPGQDPLQPIDDALESTDRE